MLPKHSPITQLIVHVCCLFYAGDGESGGGGNYFGKTAMEIRTEQYARKREAKLREKKERYVRINFFQPISRHSVFTFIYWAIILLLRAICPNT